MKLRWETSAAFSFRDGQVLMRNKFRFLFPAIAIGLLAWWWTGSDRVDAGSAPETAAGNAAAPATPPATPAVRVSQAVIPGGYVAPRLEDATPLEIEAMRSAEVERSAGSPEPPASFFGADGKRHPFQYNQSSKLSKTTAEEEDREVRRKLLMQQLRADPQKFARDNNLATKEAQWILDGTEDFPDRLLD